ncbi:hypothetical protein Pst134EA_017718 [Puccinia striiformis f. sp. tritici]|uniref:hypothetical protein n=1 Tax=Puccinia striiformis f. sp. tritici TaxID=168172 RepID=UPI002008BE7E|nr:hypothetical protein Pst134EA_017718 [Puccinia striiformis f. sp. tritici]KAH9461410.1 hypothetical protein Pst134EA_017718 [Puccinia striiformis f. sp. tritici]
MYWPTVVTTVLQTINLSLLYSRITQRTPTCTQSQGPVDFPLDQDIDKLDRLNNQRKKTPLEDVPQSTPNPKPERGRSQRHRNPDLTQNGDSDSEDDPPYKQAPEDPQGLISDLTRALNARPTSDHTTSKFKTPGMKAPDRFDGKRGRAAQWFEPCLGLLDFKKPDCILNNWDKFEQQLFTIFGDPNEVRNTEYELNNLQMKDSGKASLYIAQFCTLQSRISWNDFAFTFHFHKGLPPRITDQLAISGLHLTSLQQLIDRTIELDNCYHDKNRSKKPDTPSKQDDSSKSNNNKSSKKPHQQSSGTPALSSSKPRTRTTPQEISSVLSKEGFLKGDKRARQEKEGLCMYCGGKHDLDTCAKRLACEATKPSSKK